MKRALITGITGQDGAYLARYLLDLGYEVHGVIRRSSLIKTDRIDEIFDKINLHYGDMTDGLNLINVFDKAQPDEVYNLAAQSHVGVSFETPEYTANADALGTLRLLEIIRIHSPKTKFYQASTSELFGNSPAPQNEETPMIPRSPYAAAKLYAYHLTRNYREAYGLFAVNGVLFNHESPMRGETFITRKVVRHFVQDAVSGNERVLQVGNVWSIRDWSHAKDMVVGMHKMLQHHEPLDLVMGSGVGYTVKELIDKAWDKLYHLPGALVWRGEHGGPARAYWNDQLAVESIDKYYRPLEVNRLVADPKKAINVLGWDPKYNFDMLIEEMIAEELKNEYRLASCN